MPKAKNVIIKPDSIKIVAFKKARPDAPKFVPERRRKEDK